MELEGNNTAAVMHYRMARDCIETMIRVANENQYSGSLRDELLEGCFDLDMRRMSSKIIELCED